MLKLSWKEPKLKFGNLKLGFTLAMVKDCSNNWCLRLLSLLSGDHTRTLLLHLTILDRTIIKRIQMESSGARCQTTRMKNYPKILQFSTEVAIAGAVAMIEAATEVVIEAAMETT